MGRSADFVSMLCKDRAERFNINTSQGLKYGPPNMVHQWDKTSIEANQSPSWGFRISPPPNAGTFVADDFLVFEGNPSLCFNSALGRSPSWIIWRFLDLDQIGAIGKFY